MKLSTRDNRSATSLVRLVSTCNSAIRHRNRLGAVIPLCALMLPVVVIMAAFAINIAYLELNRTEMYIASDAASRAAGREFALTSSQNAAMIKGRLATALNTVGGKPIILDDNDFVFGVSTRLSATGRYDFTPGGALPNAVEVTTRKTVNSGNGPIEMLMPLVFGSPIVESIQTSRSNQIEVDISLVIDRSGSMAYGSTELAVFPPLPMAAPSGWFFGDPVPSPSRWIDAIGAVDVFLNELTASPLSEIVALTTYNGTPSLDRTLTSNYGDIKNTLNYYANHFDAGATNIGGGIQCGKAAFSVNARSYAAKVMIVLTDGIDTVGSDPIGAADLCADDQVMVFTITFSDEADQTTMQQVASKGNGKHYHATTGTALTAIFKDIARQLPTLISR